jgi:ribulose-phosphate 3-epimerase
MTVHPGFGGQKFIPGMEDKIASLRQEIRRRGLSTEIEIDGGVNDQNIEYLASCGASIIAAGSLVFAHQENIAARVRMLSEKIRPY